jgi:hypothetical protein
VTSIVQDALGKDPNLGFEQASISVVPPSTMARVTHVYVPLLDKWANAAVLMTVFSCDEAEVGCLKWQLTTSITVSTYNSSNDRSYSDDQNHMDQFFSYVLKLLKRKLQQLCPSANVSWENYDLACS